MKNDDLFIVIEVDEILYLLEDSRVTVEVMKNSPYLADQKAEVEYWCETLTEAEEIIHLLCTCQKKVGQCKVLLCEL